MAISEPCCPNSLTKFLLDVFSDASTSGMFYTTDMMVLIDIVTRQLSDLGPGEEVRSGRDWSGRGWWFTFSLHFTLSPPFSFPFPLLFFLSFSTPPLPPPSFTFFSFLSSPLSYPSSSSSSSPPAPSLSLQTRTHYLELLCRIVTNTDYKEHRHRCQDISSCLNRIAQEENPESERDHEVIKKLWVTFPGIFEEVTDL